VPLFWTLVLAGAALVGVVGQTAGAAETCFIEGQVLEAGRDTPLAGAELTLTRFRAKSETMGQYVFATTDFSGRFVFRDVRPGSYGLGASRRGYVSVFYGARRPGDSGKDLSLAPGQRLTGITLRLPPHSVISGLIRDQDGEPLLGVQVDLLGVTYRLGGRRLVGKLKATTDDRGSFRIWGISPGRYYVRAWMPRSQSVLLYAPVYYPGTPSEAEAAPIVLSPGTTIESLDLRLSAVKLVSVKGQVVGATAGRVTLTLHPGTLVEGDPREVTGHEVGPNESFELTRVVPGPYRLTVRAREGDREAVAQHSLNVGDAGLEGLTVAAPRPFWVAGRVVMSEETKQALSGVRIGLEPAYPDSAFNQNAWTRPAKDLTFRIEKIPCDYYAVDTDDLPDGLYVESVRSGGRDLPGRVLDLSAGVSADIEVVLGPRAAVLQGTAILADSSQPAPAAVVVLIRRTANRRLSYADYHRGVANESGAFNIRNIEPGDYTVFCWEYMDGYAFMDPQFMRAMEGKGVAITLEKGARSNLKLVAIPGAVY